MNHDLISNIAYRRSTNGTRHASRSAQSRRAIQRRRVLTLEVLEVRETPAAFHWLGGAGASGNVWSNPANWLQNAVPVAGSSLIFDTAAAGFSATTNGFAPVNDIFGLSDLTLIFNDASTAGDFSVTGNAIGLRATNGIAIDSTVSSGAGVTVANGLNLAANVIFKANLGALSLNGSIGDGPGTYSVLADNTATTTINLGGANSHDGGTSIGAGTLGVAVATSLGTGTLTMTGGKLVNLNGFLNIPNPFVINGPSTIGGGGFFHLDGNGVLNADLTLMNQGFFELNGALSGPAGIISNSFPGYTHLGGTQPNSFTGASSVLSGSLVLRKPAGVTALVAPITISGTFSGLVTEASNLIADSVAVTLGSGGSFNINNHSESILSLTSVSGGGGNVNIGGNLSVFGGGNQSFAGSVTGAGLLIYSGAGTLTLSGASPSFTGTLVAANGILAVSNNFPEAKVVVSGGTLGGSGVFKSVSASMLPVVGYVDPGGPSNIGILTTGAGPSSLAGLTYRVDLSAAGNNDRLVLGSGASINLDGSQLDFVATSSAAGNVYTIVSSPSGGISGTFSGMPKGSFIVEAGQTFQIDYTSTAVTLSHRAFGIYPAPPLAGVVGVPYSQTLAVAAGAPPYTNLNVTAFNGGGTGLTSANVTVNPAANTIAINGTATATGVVTFTASVTDNTGTTLTRNYAINFNALPSFSPATLADGAFGTAYNQVVSVVNGAPPFTSLTVTNFNAGGTGIAAPVVNLAAGTVAFGSTPTATGTVSFTVSTVDSAGGTGTKNYTFNVAKANSRVNLASSLSSGSLSGQSITFTASVSPAPPAAGTATGSVTFFDGATQIGAPVTLNASGVATLPIDSFGVGSHAITAVYSGSANLNGITSSVLTQNVAKANTTTTLTANVNPSVFGQVATFTATVRPVAPGAGVPVGSVTLFDGGSPIATFPLDSLGTANIPLPALSVGSHALAAIFVGNAGFNGSTSAIVDQVVNKALTTAFLTASPNATTGGSLVTFTATVTAVAPGAGVPSGAVSFTDGPATLGSANVDAVGVAIFTTSSLAVGSHAVVASYGGSSNFLPSMSNAATVTIIGAEPRVQSVTPNGNISALAGGRHSRVASLVVAFDRPVTLDPIAMTLAVHTSGVVYGGIAQPGGKGELPASLNVTTADNINWVVTFNGNTETGPDGFASLKDGVYDLKIDAVKVHPVGAPSVNMSANSTTTFHRLFGDIDAPGTPNGGAPGVDFAAVVTTGDNLAFRGAFNNAANYKAFLDFNGDDTINTGDNLQFRGRFNKALTWRV